jgi:hypothetical protein
MTGSQRFWLWTPVIEEVSLVHTRVSTVMAFLPASLQSRIPPIPSLRRTISMRTFNTQQDFPRDPSVVVQESIRNLEHSTPADERVVTEVKGAPALESSEATGSELSSISPAGARLSQSSGIGRRYGRHGKFFWLFLLAIASIQSNHELKWHR